MSSAERVAATRSSGFAERPSSMACALATVKNWVSTGPGFTLSTCTPCLRASTPTARLKRSTNALDALYVAMDGRGWKLATDAMFTIAPWPAAVMAPRAVWVSVMRARTLTVSSSISWSSSRWANSPWLPKPALLISRSTGLRSSTSTRVSIPSVVPRSATAICAVPPVTVWDSSVSFSVLRPVRIRAYPRSCRAWVKERPMPPVAPVIKAVRVMRSPYARAARAVCRAPPRAPRGPNAPRRRPCTPRGRPVGPTCPDRTREHRRRTS